MPISGYDASAHRFTVPNLGASAGTAAKFRQFTGKERDSESGLDYFGARYYGSALGRFTSPDEFKGGFDNLDGTAAFAAGPLPYADLSDPQTLNKYVYTRNNPLRYIDPDGHDIWDYLSGVANAFGSDNLAGAGRVKGGNDDYRLGQTVGDVVAVVTGSIEALGGGGEAVVTSPAALTGVGAVAPAAGVAVAVHGATTAAVAGGHLVTAAASKVDDIAGQIEQGGYGVTANPKTPNQEGNVTITHPDQPGAKVNVRVETHPIPGSGGQPVRHANVEVVKPGPKNRPRVVSNEHIDQ